MIFVSLSNSIQQEAPIHPIFLNFAEPNLNCTSAMASILSKAPSPYLSAASICYSSLNSTKLARVSFSRSKLVPAQFYTPRSSYYWGIIDSSPRYSYKKFVSFAANEEIVGLKTETQEEDPVQASESDSELQIEDIDMDDAIAVDAPSDDGDTPADVVPGSVVIASLNLYKEAIANKDESKSAEIESFLKSMEDEKIELERRIIILSDELSVEKDRILRISADFDNFRKRTERERLSLVKNAQGEVVENLLSVLDNFERAKTQIKVETDAEEKIVSSYQSIYKQFTEILASLGVVPVPTVGKPFDPMLHEAITRGDSTEYDEDFIIEEYRKGFQLGERLLRPSMVKVSAGPGPAKPETKVSSEDQKEASENSAEHNAEE